MTSFKRHTLLMEGQPSFYLQFQNFFGFKKSPTLQLHIGNINIQCTVKQTYEPVMQLAFSFLF